MEKRVWVALIALYLFLGGALAEVYTGVTVAGDSTVVAVASGGSLETVYCRPGSRIEAGEAIAKLRTDKVFAAEDGNVARLLASEGEQVDGIVLELSPVSRYVIYCTVDGAYASATSMRVHTGESLYIRCTSNGTHRGTGIVAQIDSDSYQVEATAGEFYVGETVYLYRDSDFTSAQRVGIGTVISAEAQPYEAQGTLVRLYVAENEYVERGELLFEIAEDPVVTLTAPISGIVTEVSAPGDVLSAGQAVLCIAPLDQIQVEIQVDEEKAAVLSPGRIVDLLRADDPEEIPLTGTIQSVSRVAEDDLYTVRITPEAPIPWLGLTVHVRIDSP